MSCVLKLVCAFYAHDMYSMDTESPIVTRAGSVSEDLRWRAAFAIELYAVLHTDAFPSLEPWLFRTGMQVLKLFTRRFGVQPIGVQPVGVLEQLYDSW